MLKKIVFILLLVVSTNCGQTNETFSIASWNVENLFDIYDDPFIDDNEFLPNSDKGWNKEKYLNKLSNLTKVIKEMNENKGPDILGLIEIENIGVLNDLKKELSQTLNKKYEIIHVESLDTRGIDNALFFNKELFNLESFKAIKVDLPENKSNTRYILRVDLQLLGLESNNKLILYINHWPSRMGGEDKSEPFRIAAASTLKRDLQISKFDEDNLNIVIMGDFNDEPNNKSIYDVLEAKSLKNYKDKSVNLFNLAFEKKELGDGTYLYRENWNMLDQMIISKGLLNGTNISYMNDSFNIIRFDYMVTPEGKYKDSPIRTYAGKKYLGGYSDHFPIEAKFCIKTK